MILIQLWSNLQTIRWKKQGRFLKENIYIDLDAKGNPVSMTIEHARCYRTSAGYYISAD